MCVCACVCVSACVQGCVSNTVCESCMCKWKHTNAYTNKESEADRVERYKRVEQVRAK